MKLWSAAVATFLLLGCGSEVETTGGSGGTGGATGGGGEAGQGGEGGQGGTLEACTGFDDAPSTTPVTLRITNQTPVDIYLDAICGLLNYGVEPLSGPDGLYYGDVGGACLQSCEELQSESQIACAACAPSSLLLPAGQSLDVVWAGLALQPAEMPAECYFDQVGGEPMCNQIVQAANGDYSLKVAGYDGCDTGVNGLCECDAAGVCSGGISGLEAVAKPVEFALPAAGPVEYVFEPCAFGCPNP